MFMFKRHFQIDSVPRAIALARAVIFLALAGFAIAAAHIAATHTGDERFTGSVAAFVAAAVAVRLYTNKKTAINRALSEIEKRGRQ